MEEARQLGGTGTAARKAWDRVFPMARMIFHTALALYLLCQFARTTFIPAAYSALVHTTATTIQDGVRIALLVLGLAELLKDWKAGLLKLALMGTAWVVSNQSHNYNNVYDFTAFLLLSDLAEEKGAIRLNLLLHWVMLLVLVRLTAHGLELFQGEHLHSLGASNLNTTAALLLSILLLTWAAGLKKHPLITLGVFWACAAVSEYLTSSHSVTVLLIVFPLLSPAIMRIGKGKHAGLLRGLNALPLLLAALCVGAMLWVSGQQNAKELTGFLNTFSHRFLHGAEYYLQHGISWRGTPSDAYTTDNLYLNILLCHGAVGFALVVGLMTWSMHRLCRKGRYDLLAVQVLMAFYGVMETVPIALLINFVPAVLLSAERERAEEAVTAQEGKKDYRYKIILSAGVAVVFAALALLLPEIHVARQTMRLNRAEDFTAGNPWDEGMELRQTFRLGNGRFSGVSFQVATYMTRPRGSFTVALEDKTGKQVEEKQVDAGTLTDNSFVTVLFDESYRMGRYTLVIRDIKLTDGSMTLWVSRENSYGNGALFINGQETTQDMLLEVVRVQSRARLSRILAEVCTGLLLIAMIWIFLPTPLRQSGAEQPVRVRESQGVYIRTGHGEEAAKTLGKGAFARVVALTLAVYALLAGLFFWILGDDWRRTVVSTEPVNRVSLLPVMEGGREIRQSMTVSPDDLFRLELGINVLPETAEGNSLTVRLEENGTVLKEWTAQAAKIGAGQDLVLEADPPLTGMAGRQVTLVLGGCDAAAYWYGNTRSAGKYDVAVESAGTLTVDGNPVEGELVIRQVGYRRMTYMRWFWPGAALGGLLLAAGMIFAHSRRVRRKPFFLNDLIDEVRRYWYLLKMLVIRDFNVKYRSSVLGVLWSFLNPMLMTFVYMFVFSTIFQNSIQNFTVYVMSGIVLFNYLSDASNLCMQSIVGNAGLITKVYMPKYIFPVSKAISSAINLVISMIPLLLIMLLTGVPFSRSLLLLPLVMLFLVTFCVGLGLMLSSALVFFRDVQFLWGIVMMIWNFLSPLFYPESIIPAQFQTLYHLNPMYQYLFFMRTITLGGISPNPMTYLYCTLCSLASLALGIWVFRKNQDRFVLHL